MLVEMVCGPRQLYGTGYNAGPGQRFRCPQDVADSLMERGLAYRYHEPAALPKFVKYETKPITPATKKGDANA